jgi:CRP-like cAMP-binding protein
MPFRNWILRELPLHEHDRLTPHLHPVHLQQREVLIDPGRPIAQVCFPEDALVSLVAVMMDGSAIESGMVGCEGMVGLPLFHGVDRTVAHALVQVPGRAHTLAADAFRALLDELPTLRARLHHYTVSLLTAVSQVSACNRKHPIDARCARWLLTVHDGVGRDQFEVTHQFLSQMLGVRRATVTVAAGLLQERDLISYSRGRLVIRDRPGLERVACECYGVIRAETVRLREGGIGEARSPRQTSDAGLSLVGDAGLSVAESADLEDLRRRGLLEDGSPRA